MSTIRFKATDDQAKEIAAKAINASLPAGMGFLHYNPNSIFTAKDVPTYKGAIHIDYVQGRMVKLYMEKDKDGVWGIHGEPNSEYQSWVQKYPSYFDLVCSVEGVEIQ